MLRRDSFCPLYNPSSCARNSNTLTPLTHCWMQTASRALLSQKQPQFVCACLAPKNYRATGSLSRVCAPRARSLWGVLWTPRYYQSQCEDLDFRACLIMAKIVDGRFKSCAPGRLSRSDASTILSSVTAGRLAQCPISWDCGRLKFLPPNWNEVRVLFEIQTCRTYPHSTEPAWRERDQQQHTL
jgi:hypothetical protein